MSKLHLVSGEFADMKTKIERYKTTALHSSELDDGFINGMLSEPISEEAEQYNDEFPLPICERE